MAALIIVAGCTEQKNAANSRGAADAGSSATKRITIAVIPKAATHEFWKSVHFGAGESGRRIGECGHSMEIAGARR